jgi:hypothetical protein
MKYLIACCDGTWNTADQRHDGSRSPPTWSGSITPSRSRNARAL